jgi:ABC-type glycerol-3-phosphate transport system substrate-binding protein
VAPGALPDLTLLRREDLLAAVEAGLIYPLEGEISATVLGDLYPSALGLGQVEGQLYGVPYTVDVQHMAFRPRENTVASSRFEDILANNIRFAMPAAQTAQINGVLLTQYMAAGGVLPLDGATGVDVQALREVVQFYEAAITQNLINPAVLNYTSPMEYEAEIVSGVLDAGVIDSSSYLRLSDSGSVLDFGPVFTGSGEMVGEADGWVWVMTTSSADRQALAARFLNWMLNTTRQGEYSQTILMIPSQRTALQAWDDSEYIHFVRELLNTALLPISDEEGGTFGRALQNALVAVLSRERSAEEAAQDLIERLNG